MSKLNSLRRGATVALLVAAGAAQAHPGHGASGFADALAHPFLGLDHLLAMVAVGAWSAAALPAGRRIAGPAVSRRRVGRLSFGLPSRSVAARLKPAIFLLRIR